MKIKSLRAFRLISKTGHTVEIPADVAVEIPDICAAEAFAAGCALVEAGSPVAPPVVVAPPVDPVIDEAPIKIAIYQLIDANDPKAFKKDGAPKVEAVAAAMGAPVTAEEVATAWDSISSE